MYNNPYQQQYASPYYTAYNAPNFNGGSYANMFTQQQANSPQNGPQSPTQQMTPNQQSIEYVNGLAGAQGFLMQPNSTKWLMDSDDKFFYIKSSNAQGQATVRMFRYWALDLRCTRRCVRHMGLHRGNSRLLLDCQISGGEIPPHFTIDTAFII